jgi:hypothetical protein
LGKHRRGMRATTDKEGRRGLGEMCSATKRIHIPHFFNCRACSFRHELISRWFNVNLKKSGSSSPGSGAELSQSSTALLSNPSARAFEAANGHTEPKTGGNEDATHPELSTARPAAWGRHVICSSA